MQPKSVYTAYLHWLTWSTYIDDYLAPLWVQRIAMSVSVCPFVSPLAYLNKWSAVAEMGDWLATIDMVRKLGAVLFFLGSWVPSNMVWPGPMPTSVPSGILIHPAIWPQ